MQDITKDGKDLLNLIEKTCKEFMKERKIQNTDLGKPGPFAEKLVDVILTAVSEGV